MYCSLLCNILIFDFVKLIYREVQCTSNHGHVSFFLLWPVFKASCLLPNSKRCKTKTTYLKILPKKEDYQKIQNTWKYKLVLLSHSLSCTLIEPSLKDWQDHWGNSKVVDNCGGGKRVQIIFMIWLQCTSVEWIGIFAN